MGAAQVDTVYDYAKTIYECGDYAAARELLDQYSTYSIDAAKILSSIWGKLACEILTADVRCCSPTSCCTRLCATCECSRGPRCAAQEPLHRAQRRRLMRRDAGRSMTTRSRR